MSYRVQGMNYTMFSDLELYELKAQFKREIMASIDSHNQRGRVVMLDQLKRVNIDAAQMDEVLSLLVFAKGLRAEYEANTVEVPSWLTDKIRLLGRFVEMSRRDGLEKRLELARAERDRLKTPQERREAAEAEIARLTAELEGRSIATPALAQPELTGKAG